MIANLLRKRTNGFLNAKMASYIFQISKGHQVENFGLYLIILQNTQDIKQNFSSSPRGGTR